MIYVLVGEDTVASRNKLNDFLKSKKNIVRIDGKKQTITDFEEALISGDLFEDAKTVVVESFSKLKPEKIFIDLLSGAENHIDIFLWDEKPHTLKLDKKNVQILSFEYPKVYFAFMDSFSSRTTQKSLRLLNEVLKTNSAEQILYSIIKRLRQLLILKSENFMEFEDFKKMSSWQLNKLKQQSSLWSEKQLAQSFVSFAKLDEQIKSGGLTMELSRHLDFLLQSDLN